MEDAQRELKKPPGADPGHSPSYPQTHDVLHGEGWRVIEVPKSRYGQITELLTARIKDGTYPAGSVFPSEEALAAELGVSRPTVNRAISLLRTAGLVRVVRGKATRVQDATVWDRHAQAGDRLGELGPVESERVTAPARERDILGTGSLPVLRRTQVGYAGGVAAEICTSWTPSDIADAVPALTGVSIGAQSHEHLAGAGLGPVRFTEAVTVRMPTAPEALTLGLEAGQSVFHIEYVAYDATGCPVEVCTYVMAAHLWRLRYRWDTAT